MRRTRAAAGAALLAAGGGAVAISGAERAAPVARETPADTVPVQRGELASMVSLAGTLTYRARADGSPYAAINQATGIYTELPREGEKVRCGDVLYRVDDDPVLMLCGTIPAYRDLDTGDAGRDVRQLKRNLRKLGHHPGAGGEFTQKTEDALEKLQRGSGLDATGALDAEDVVVLPGRARIAKVTGRLGGLARPGGQVALATSATLEVQVNLAASQQGEVRKGDRARSPCRATPRSRGGWSASGESRGQRETTPTSAMRRSPPTSGSTTRRRRAASTARRSRWTSRRKACRVR